MDFSAPRGMRDFYPEDMILRNRVFDAWRSAAVSFGFEQYDACVVESLDLLKRKAGEEVENQVYAFQDKSGREIALRAEMTPTLARMVAARQGSLQFPVKWFCIAQCFRYERMTKGRKREHYQLNLDIVGEDGAAGEAEVIAAAVCAMRKMGVPDEAYRVRLSSRALLSELLDKKGIDAKFHSGVFIALDKKGKMPREEIEEILRADGLGDEECAKAFDLTDISSLDEAAAIAGADSPAVARIRELLSLLELYGVASQVVFDISVIRGLSYYTGVVFEAFDTKGEFRAIFGGGRYDNLLTAIGGKPTPAVGLGFGDVVVGELLKSLGIADPAPKRDLVAVGYMTEAQRAAATRLAARLRGDGRNASLQLRPQKAKQFFAAAGDKATHAVYVGPDDEQAGTARLKDLATREQSEIPLS
ncbi:MAG: histidine--tRNA ligase [Kiritimatiellae bacterium]|nr:histidine--tRNA ligase [Kiritimatiellia bacterium]